MSLNSFVLQNEKINKNLQISRKIAEKCIDHLQESFKELGLNIEKRDLVPLSISAYARFKEQHQIGPYEKKVMEIRSKEPRDIATTPELSEDYLALMFALSISELGAEKTIDEVVEAQKIWSHAIEVGLVILTEMFDNTYANRPSAFFEALEDLGEEGKKVSF